MFGLEIIHVNKRVPSLLKYLALFNRFEIWQLTRIAWLPGGRLNKKDGLTRYGDSHVKDKTS